ncbi:Peroxisomal membrane protein PAS20 [Cladophialophora chaetospira]|uniref:Peroxisomal membrane protein PAS20 n=1 Tax=Cladophialophora chaetospira TaxID=386627 RepID=A0AA38XNL5_9EURO|nr:Peroxisomal membrane protein PAS20 [Cladophialophora chaetospira]
MAEVIGIVASAISVAGLFKACIEAFEVIKAARKQELDFHKAVLKLQIEKCRLYTWGEAMGLTSPPDPGQPRPLETFEFKSVVVDILSMLLRLFSDTSKLEDRYGCRVDKEAITSAQPAVTLGGTDHIGNLSASFSNFQFNNNEVDTSLKKKLKWLVHDRKKFPALVSEAREFIDGLQDITNSISPAGVQTQAAAHRIQQVSQPDTLQLLADVCETDYPVFSDAASVRLEIVSMSPTRRHEIEQWTNDIELSENKFTELESMTVTEMKHRLLQYMSRERVPTVGGNLDDGLYLYDSELGEHVTTFRVPPSQIDPSVKAALSLFPKLRSKENAKDTLCRNVTIYGKCRYEDKGCRYNHTIQKEGLEVTPTRAAEDGTMPSAQPKPFRVVSNPRYNRGHVDPDELGPYISDGKLRGLQTLPLQPMPLPDESIKPPQTDT